MPEADALPRQTRLRQWAARHHGLDPAEVELRLAAGDASFRRYYRLRLPDGSTRMLMDAPPDREHSTPFVCVARRWAEAGLPVPALHGVDLEAGFLELDDLGDTPLQARLGAADDPDTLAWYERALALLDALQTRAAPEGLPPYDAELLGRELDLFPDWCLARWLDLPLPPGWASLREALIADALAQPVVTVHRDFDAMNLMVVGERLYLIDFQDAVAGPLSYDLISLLHGRYCRFAPAQRAAWIEAFRRRAVDDGRLDAAVAPTAFRRQVAAMAAQRSLKVLGIFCRLTLRDHREGYLARLPHFLAHLEDALAELEGHVAFRNWLADSFRPALAVKLAKAGIVREGTA